VHFHHGPPEEHEGRPKPHVLKTYSRLLRYLKPYWKLVALALFLTLPISFMSVLPQQLFGVVVDAFRQSFMGTHGQVAAAPAVKCPLIFDAPLRAAADFVHEHWLSGMSNVTVLILLVGVASLLLRLADSSISMVHGYIMARVGQGVTFDMRNDAYGHLQKLSLRYFTDRSTGDLMSRVVSDVDSLNTVIVSPIADFLRDFCQLGWILYFCISWDWKLTLVGFVVTPGLLVTTFFFGRFIRQAFRMLRRKVGELNALIQENISGIRVIKGFGHEDHEMDRFRAKNLDTFRQYMRITKLFIFFRPIVDLCSHVGMVVVICYGAYRVIAGHLSPGTFIVFMPYVRMFFEPIQGLSRFYNMIQQAVASVERVFEVLDFEPEVQDAPGAVDLRNIEGRVEFRGVSFSYAKGIQVLKDIHLAAEPGQMIAFVGPSGAGKTTVINLLLRFYDPERGAVLLDGRDMRQITIRSLRSKMAMVLQEAFLFNDTVRANIAYGKLNATEEEIVHAAESANAHDFIMALSDGYNTVIGERGVRLSGGQQQRLSIARAVLANPRILILDEATSSVDSETETLIQNAIYRLVRNRTTFVIAHRLSTVLHAHKIIVLNEGRIVEEGGHQELLAMGGLYKKLFDMQFRAGYAMTPEAAPAMTREEVEPELAPPTAEGRPPIVF
jgi:subfamily B ATP-binding cassette protein MsbA